MDSNDAKFQRMLDNLPELGGHSVFAPVEKYSSSGIRDSIINALMLAKDMRQTQKIDDIGHTEINPILGPTPSDRRIKQYFGLAALGDIVANQELPPSLRDVYNAGLRGTEIWAINNNWKAGHK